VTGYNIMGSRLQYIYRRAQELSKLLAADLELGRIPLSARPQRWCGAAPQQLRPGDNDLSYLTPGRLLFDTMNLVEGTTSSTATLNTVACHHRRRQGRHTLATSSACTRATTTTGRWWPNTARLRPLQPALREAVRRDGRVRHGGGPGAHDLIFRGQGAKALSLVSRRQDGYAIPVLGVAGVKFQGALVLEPETGVYMDDRSSCWTSLRCTSSMISVNLSHDTLLPPGDEGQARAR
jgi:hypothetical protein